MSGRNAVTLNVTGQVIRYGASDLENDGTFNGSIETYHTNVGLIIEGLPLKYTKVSGGVLTEMTSGEKDAVDANDTSDLELEQSGVGEDILSNLTTGSNNTALGNMALNTITTGSDNISVGNSAGDSLTLNDSNNICIGNSGVSGDNGEIRIGTSGTHGCVTLPGSLSLVDEQYEAPLTGATVTILNTRSIIIIDPAGTLATLTINMPASPKDGQIIKINITQNITNLTHSGNGKALIGPFSSNISANASGTWYFRGADNTWYPINIAITGISVTSSSGATSVNQVAKYSDTTGLDITKSGIIIDNSNNITGAINITSTGNMQGLDLIATDELRLRESAGGLTEFTGFKAPSALGADLIYTLPSVAGTAGQVLQTDASNVLSWATAGGGGLDDYTYTSTSINYTILDTDNMVGVDSSSIAITVTLPIIASSGKKIIVVADIGGNAFNNNITINRGSTDLINGSTSTVIAGDYNSITFWNDNSSNWFFI